MNLFQLQPDITRHLLILSDLQVCIVIIILLINSHYCQTFKDLKKQKLNSVSIKLTL